MAVFNNWLTKFLKTDQLDPVILYELVPSALLTEMYIVSLANYL